jgi:GNAT superfamily N-acetyltransferase
MDVQIKRATPGRWAELEELFGPSGAYSGCWCMFFRQTSAEFSEKAGKRNRAELKALVERRKVPGLVGYVDGRPAGWVSIAPRKQFGRIERSRLLAPLDDAPVWSIVCLFIHRAHRGRGLAGHLLEGAVEHARSKGARVVEGYPIDLTKVERRIPAAELYIGTLDMFERAGFEVALRRKESRPIVRRYL